MEQIKCPICLESVGAARVTLECGHVHCVACFARWCHASNKCTCCRAEFTEVNPSTETKVTIHNSQISELLEHTRGQNKNVNHKKYNEIVALSRQPAETYDKDELIYQFNRLIDINTWTMARHVQHFYESN